MSNEITELYDFAYFRQREFTWNELARLAEDEDWSSSEAETDYPNPILYHYIRLTFRRLAEEDKIEYSEDNSYACFNTGLLSKHQEEIFAYFVKNNNPDREPWFFLRWITEGAQDLSQFRQKPKLAKYYDDPLQLVFDHRLELVVSKEHILRDNRDRFPDEFSELDDHSLGVLLDGAIQYAIELAKRSYKTAIPQYYSGRIQLLLPLCLTQRGKADLALVIEKVDPGDRYRASTVLTLPMAYSSARLLAKQDRHWLIPNPQ